MKVNFKVLVFFCFSLVAAAASGTELDLMPYPQAVTLTGGTLALDKTFYVVIEGESSPLLREETKRFLQRVKLQTGLPVKTAVAEQTKNKKKSSPYLRIDIANPGEDKSGYALVKNESYRLQVFSSHIYLSAAHPVGAIRALETLLQLIGLQKSPVVIAQVIIDDAPRFAWRGVLLDSSRHFLSLDTLKRQLDAMAAAKYNVFHWHLTDDQGWRMESKAYPKLHRLASGGEYYSHQQIRELVAYASQRGIHILPEIDIPGHASAIALAYPELIAAPGPYKQELRWGVHKPTLNPVDEKVYQFIDSLMAEVSALFPFEYVHIGGDEVDPEQWNNNSTIQQFMREEGLTDHRAMQAWFNRRLVKILAQYQRKMIGWDEIQHPDLPRNIVIQSWQGPDAVSDAVSHGFQAILSTGYYLDQPQPAAYHYRNDPIPVVEKIDEQVRADETWQTWSFEIPRKRGNSIRGSFTLIADKDAYQRGFIDFSGKSRRALHDLKAIDDSVQFKLDTWMGVFNPHINLAGRDLTGSVVVGNVHYEISGQQIAGSEMKGTRMPEAIRQQPLTEQARSLVLGGEAALWGELVDDTVIDLRLWPRAFAVAERLWSPVYLRDENGLYRRMEKISTWAEVSVGLLHRKQAQLGMRSFGDKKTDIAPLEIFAQAIEQAQYYHRHHEKHVYGTYSKSDLLNLFADTLPAESVAVRQLGMLVDKFISNPNDKAAQQQLKRFLQAWVDNYPQLAALIRANQRLASLEILARRVNDVSLLGLTLVERVTQNKPLSADEIKEFRKILRRAQQLHQEIVVSAAYPIERLLQASY